MSKRVGLRGRWAATLGAIATVAVAVAGCGSSGDSSGGTGKTAQRYDTIKPGVLKVAVESYMSYTALRGGKLIGLDSDIIDSIAKKLDLKVEPELTDFNGMLGGVQSRRVDVTVGGVAWSKEREEAGLFTDPPYYSPPAMGVQSGKSYSTVDNLQGKASGR